MFNSPCHKGLFGLDKERPIKIPLAAQLECAFDPQGPKEHFEVRQGVPTCQSLTPAPYPAVVLKTYLLRRKRPHQYPVRQGKQTVEKRRSHPPTPLPTKRKRSRVLRLQGYYLPIPIVEGLSYYFGCFYHVCGCRPHDKNTHTSLSALRRVPHVGEQRRFGGIASRPFRGTRLYFGSRLACAGVPTYSRGKQGFPK